MSLYERIYEAVRLVPYGQVASYSQIAKAIGMPRGARIVGWALRALPDGSDVPWQRIINQRRWISIINPKVPKSLQRELLEAEGRTVVEQNGVFVVMGDDWYQGYVQAPKTYSPDSE